MVFVQLTHTDINGVREALLFVARSTPATRSMRVERVQDKARAFVGDLLRNLEQGKAAQSRACVRGARHGE